MNNDINIERFTKDPDILIKLCQDVIDRICNTSEDPKIAEQEAQLREIAKAISKLEKINVPIPDALRAEKGKLAAALVCKDDGVPALYLLAKGFEEILKALNRRLNRVKNHATSGKMQGIKKTRTPKTKSKILRENIIIALRKLGGRAKAASVIKEMERQLEGRLLPGDLDWLDSTNEHVWRNNAGWERNQMRREGIIRSDSPHGIWELTEEYR